MEAMIDLFVHSVCAVSALFGLVCGFVFWLWLFIKIGG